MMPRPAARRAPCLRQRQAGAAAVELALLLPILVAFFGIGIFIASVLWHYTMVQKAAQDGARYLSTVSASEMMSPASARAAGDLAKQIIALEMRDMSPGAEIVTAETFCDNVLCGQKFAGSVPTTVRVHLSIAMKDPTGQIDTGIAGWPIITDYTIRYVGN